MSFILHFKTCLQKAQRDPAGETPEEDVATPSSPDGEDADAMSLQDSQGFDALLSQPLNEMEQQTV